MLYTNLFLFSFFISVILVFFSIRIGNKYRFFDIASEDDVLKIHKESISYLGGMAMFVAVCIISLLIVFKFDYYLFKNTALILFASLPIFILGFWDDLNWKNIPQPKPFKKFVFLIIVPLFSASILFFADVQIKLSGIAVIDYSLTFFYIFVLVNSVNYEDGIDGLAGGSTFFSLIGFLIISLFLKNELGILLSIISAGSVLGFLLFNKPPAKIFMGDSGAFFLGYMLSVFAMLFSARYSILFLLAPVFISGFPVFEGVFTNARRIYNKKSIFFGDRKHLYDILYLKKRLSIGKTLLICYLIQVLFVVLGLIIYLW